MYTSIFEEEEKFIYIYFQPCQAERQLKKKKSKRISWEKDSYNADLMKNCTRSLNLILKFFREKFVQTELS